MSMVRGSHVVRITPRAMPERRVPMIFLLTLGLLTPGKHCRPFLLELRFLRGLLSANRVRVRTRPGTPTTSSCSYLVPAIGERVLWLERSRAWGCICSLPMFGEEVGSMMERVDDGDLSLEQCPKPVHGLGNSERPRVRHALGACTK